MSAAAQEYPVVMEMPVGGIMSFVTSNMDEIDDRVLAFGRGSGINSMYEIGERMANLGRYEDDQLVHAATGEIVIPRGILEENPEVASSLREAFGNYGVDFDRYVVGSESNSINPATGRPEFFLKKIVKKVKKAVKKVGQVIKKAAKVVVPIALNFVMPGLGTIASAAIGTTIGGLIQGEDLKTALRGGITAGLTAGVFSGVQGAIGSIGDPTKNVFQGFKQGFTGALPATTDTFKTRFSYDKADRPGVFSTETGRAFQEKMAAAAVPPSGPMATPTVSAQGQEKTFLQKLGLEKSPTPDQGQQFVDNYERIAKYSAEKGLNLSESAITDMAVKASEGAAKSSVGSSLLKYGLPALTIAGATGAFDPIPEEQIDMSSYGVDVTDSSEARLAQNPEMYGVGTPAASQYVDPSATLYAGEDLVPGTAKRYSAQEISPAAVYADLTPTGAGTFLPGSQGVPVYTPPTPVNIPGYNPEVTGMRPAPLYGTDVRGNPVYSPYYAGPVTPAQYQSSPILTPEELLLAEQRMLAGQTVAAAAGGGGMDVSQFPRRYGAIEGPGTETSDSIPAMLSDGEFVFTAKAVRNAGNGSREKGFRKMYDMMRAFEGGAVA